MQQELINLFIIVCMICVVVCLLVIAFGDKNEVHVVWGREAGLELSGAVTTYAISKLDPCVDLLLNIDGLQYNVGKPKDLHHLIMLLKQLDIGWWGLDENECVCVNGFHNFNEMTQGGNVVGTPINIDKLS